MCIRDRGTLDDAGGRHFNRAGFLSLDGTLAVNGHTQRVDHAAEQGVAHRDFHDALGTLDRIAFADVLVRTQDNGTDQILFEVLCQMCIRDRFHTIEQALEDLRQGKIILVTDDADRENEGDMICAAEFATTENVNFMATHAKGLICMPMSQEYIEKLQLAQMVTRNTDNHETAFTVSIDHVDTTTGISAAERSITAMKCVADDAKPEDFRRPGHMFPCLLYTSRCV